MVEDQVPSFPLHSQGVHVNNSGGWTLWRESVALTGSFLKTFWNQADRSRFSLTAALEQNNVIHHISRVKGESIMKRITVCLAVLLLAFFLASCGADVEGFQTQIKDSMQSKFNTDDQYAKYKMTVESVTLVASSGNNYEGIAKVAFNKKEYEIPITATSDGKSSMWQTKPLAFAFLAQYELQKLNQ